MDESGAVLIGAKITVINLATKIEQTTTTNDQGIFAMSFLSPSVYTVRTNLAGFSANEVRNVELHINDHIELNIHLEVGDITETVTVEGAGSLIKTESAAIGTVVTRKLIDALPVNGRSFQSLVALAPGVTMTRSDATNQGQFSVNGQRADSNYFSVDGVSANISSANYAAGGTAPANNAVGSSAGLVSLDALQELSIQTSTYAPEFGRGSGGQIGVVTRSGSELFRGSVYEYFRNDALDANDWFANSRGLGKPPLRHNNFGGVLGGPIAKERLFFFFSYEGLRLRQPVTLLTTVPTISLRQSAPAAMQPYLNAFPIPNGEILSPTRARFSAIFSNPRTMDAISLRIDHKATDRLSFFGRYNYAPSKIVERRGSGSYNTDRKSDIGTLTVGSTWMLTSSIVNDIRTNLSRSRSDSVSRLTDFGGAVPLPDSLIYQSPFATPGKSSFGFGIDAASISVGNSGSRQRQLNIVDTLSVNRGTHQLRFGIDYRSMRPVSLTADYLQSITTTGTLISTSRASRVTVSSRLSGVYPHFQNFSAFVQDTWKVSPRFTLVYGLRWDLNPPPSEKNGNYPYSGTGEPFQVSEKSEAFWPTRFDNFAPRLGAAYLLRSNPGSETVLRGGFGVFYDLAMGTPGAAMRAGFFPYSGTKILTNVILPLTEAQAAPPELGANTTVIEGWAFDNDIRGPRTYQWSFGIQLALGQRQSVTASYVGSAGRRLISDLFFFEEQPIILRQHFVDDTGSSDYNSLQVLYERRTSRGLNATVSYTLGKSLDTSSNDSSYLSSVDEDLLLLDRAPSDFDVRHTLSAGITFEIPAWRPYRLVSMLTRGWTFNSMFILRSAMPIVWMEAYKTTCIGNECFLECDPLPNSVCPRPDIVPGVPVFLKGSEYPGGKRLNSAAFASPPPGRQGTLARNALRGFPASQVNVSISRNFRIKENISLQLNGEGFNIFNHPNFADPYGIFYGLPEFDEDFGLATQMLGSVMGRTGSAGEAGLNPIYQIGTPRSFQFSMRLKF